MFNVNTRVAVATKFTITSYHCELHSVEPHHVQIHYGGNGVKCDFYTAEGEISISILHCYKQKIELANIKTWYK